MNKLGLLDELPRTILAHTPTPLEMMPNLSNALGQSELWIKRDDCTGLGTGGNKVRQLEYYLGQAQMHDADTLLITGAVQSNFTRLAAAAARKNGMECHIQLEHRVSNPAARYFDSGNRLLSQVFGASFNEYSDGEDEAGADQNLEHIADEMRSNGKKPYVIHLGADHPSYGALGYVQCARELLAQINSQKCNIDRIFVASGSGATHSGLLFGLRALGCNISVSGICVRRSAALQFSRIINHCIKISELLEIPNPVKKPDIELNDEILGPGYGKINDHLLEAIKLSAHHEGLLLDPVYTGRVMAGMISWVRSNSSGENFLFIHTGGQAALFGYGEELSPILSGKNE